MRTLLTGLEDAFLAIGGGPQELLFDQMKAVITRDLRLQGGALVHNLEFLRFANHWGFMPRACRPYRAQMKGKVERPVRYGLPVFLKPFVRQGQLRYGRTRTSRPATSGNARLKRCSRVRESARRRWMLFAQKELRRNRMSGAVNDWPLTSANVHVNVASSYSPATQSGPASDPWGGIVDPPNARAKSCGENGPVSIGADVSGDVTRAENDAIVNGPVPWLVIRKV